MELDYKKLAEGVGEILKPTIEKTIDEKVNGGIRNLDTKVSKHIENDKLWKKDVTKKLEQLRPIRDGVRWFEVTAKFIKWLSRSYILPLSIIGGAILWIISLIK